MNHPERITRLLEMKRAGEKIAILTAYDAGFARVLEAAGVDAVLVGDSLGMVLHGAADTLGVRLDDMVYHTRITAAGLRGTLLIADMPYQSYDEPSQTVIHARRLVEEGGADMVKLEGGREVVPQVEALRAAGIPVCGHLGLQPQSVYKYGGFKVQGRDPDQAARIREDAARLEAAGAGLLVLECIPRALAADITRSIAIPTIGIGAGPDCDGQVLVLYDVIGISSYIPKMAYDFLAQGGNIAGAVREYVDAVKTGRFPTPRQSFD